jgi:CubicO group peptidase (beta-lactamase class C family)
MKLWRIILLLAIVTYSQESVAQLAKQSIHDIMNPIDTFMEKRMKESGMVGIGAAIIINNEVVWSKGFGYADRENKLPFTVNTIMNIGSISKTFTGVCLMKAVEEKKLSLDEDINRYLPFKVINPFFPGEKITLRHIATHTSGIADRYPLYDSTYYKMGDTPEPLGEFLKNYFVPGGRYYSKENFYNNKPGAAREYSNIAAGLAGYIVELVTGKKLNEYSRQYIFKPLDMKNTGWLFSEINLKNHAKLYDKKGDTISPVQLYGLTTYPDGGVRTTVTDLSKFFIALLDEGEYNGARILKKETVREMTRFHFTADNKPGNVNFAKLNSGIFWATKFGGTRMGHAGSDPGVKAEMLSDLSKEVAVILLTNTSLEDAGTLKYHFPIVDELFKYGRKLKER